MLDKILKFQLYGGTVKKKIKKIAETLVEKHFEEEIMSVPNTFLGFSANDLRSYLFPL